jgi:hypothetical protein
MNDISVERSWCDSPLLSFACKSATDLAQTASAKMRLARSFLNTPKQPPSSAITVIPRVQIHIFLLARLLAAAVPNKNTPLMCKFSDRKINGRIGSRARGVARNKTVFGLHASEMSLKKSCLCTSPGVGVRGARVTGRARRARCRRPSKSLPRANSSRLKTLADISDQN